MADVDRLFEEHHARLFRYLVRFSGDADKAADAAQEAFVRLIERPPAGGFTRAWLYTVATNALMEQSRTATRRLRLLQNAPERAPLSDPPPNALDQLEAQEKTRVVRTALNTLNAKERTALLMREEGFSHREIATAVQSTTGSVGTLIARALERVTRQLTQTPGLT